MPLSYSIPLHVNLLTFLKTSYVLKSKVETSIFVMPRKENIPESKRAQIVALMLHTKQTHASIAKNLGISRPTVTKVINCFKKTGSYSVGRHTGRRRKTTKRDDSVICRQASIDPAP